MNLTILRDPDQMRTLVREWRGQGHSIGVVPTMGALHEGHLSLVRAARAACDRVIVTIFVNPRQFNNPEDLAKYPRTENEDAALLAPLQVDAVLVPDAATVYPPDHSTLITMSGITQPLEGAYRPGHFDGMATVVALLLNMTQADMAFFGEKDWQQLQVVRKLVADLQMPVQIIACPTIRADDGLALSSRNRQLSPASRDHATVLPDALFEAAQQIATGADHDIALAAARGALSAAGYESIDYLALCDAETLGAPQSGRPARLLAAAWIDGVRLIDNIAVTLPE